MQKWRIVFGVLLITMLGLSFGFSPARAARAASTIQQAQLQQARTLSLGSNSAEDTFNRTKTTAGWGSTTNGDNLTNLAWGDDAASSSLAVIGANRAKLLYPGSTGASVKGYLPVSAAQSGEVLAKVSFSAVGQGYISLTLDHSSGDANWYQLRLSTVTNVLSLYKKSSGTFTQLGSSVALSFTPQANTWYWLRFNVSTSSGTATLNGRAWQEGSSDPGPGWQISATDSSALAAGAVGVVAVWPNAGTGQSISIEGFAYAPTGSALAPSSTTVYHTNGQAVVDNAGNTLPIYGVQVGELMDPTWSTLPSKTNLTPSFIQAMHDTWHANTLRLQLTNENLCAPGTITFDPSNNNGYCKSDPLLQKPNASYVSEIKQVVGWAETADMNIIITQQYETDGRYTSKPKMPIADGLAFWKNMAQTFAGDSHVWFDLFNEPDENNNYTGTQCPSTYGLSYCHFDCLKNGYNANDSILQYCTDENNNGNGVGYEALVKTIRQYDTSNLLIAEGNANGKMGRWVHYYNGTFDDFRLDDTGTVGGQNQIIYAIHPYFGNQDNNTPNNTKSSWDNDFGSDYTLAANNGFPFVLIADEFGVYDSTGANCTNSWLNGSPVTSTFFPYLQGLGIGLVGYSMLPGHLINVPPPPPPPTPPDPWPVNNPTTETTPTCSYTGTPTPNQYNSNPVYGDGQAQMDQDVSYNTYWP